MRTTRCPFGYLWDKSVGLIQPLQSDLYLLQCAVLKNDRSCLFKFCILRIWSDWSSPCALASAASPTHTLTLDGVLANRMSQMASCDFSSNQNQPAWCVVKLELPTAQHQWLFRVEWGQESCRERWNLSSKVTFYHMWGWRRVNISKHDHKPVIFGMVNLWDVLKKDSCRLESQLSSFSREGGGGDTTSQSDNG